jgi:hypothetical protein
MIKSAAIVKTKTLSAAKELRLQKRKLKKAQTIERKAIKQVRPSPIGRQIVEVLDEPIEIFEVVELIETLEVVEDTPPTRTELETKAIELGIKFDGRTKDKKLGQLIEEKLGA